MNKYLISSFLFISVVSINFSQASETRNDLMIFESKHSVNDTSKNLKELLIAKGFTIFTTVDHQAGAHKAGLELTETQVIIFGNPKIGSKLMQCAPTIAIDLPQKALIWKDSDNKVWLSMNNPSYLKKRHQVKGCDAIFPKITAALKAFSIKATQQ